MTMNSVQEIAYLITTSMNVPTSVSGAMLDIVDSARQYVENYTGISIPISGIQTAYQGAVLDFARADAVDMVNAQPGGESLSLGELSLSETGDALSAEQYRMLGESKLKAIGRGIGFVRSLS